jgi:transcriptional regulator with XRE-family HTH domain
LNFLEKLDYLLEEYHINKATLAKESGIPLSTILSWYDPNKGYKNIRLATLQALENYFKCGYDFLADETITPDIKDINDEEVLVRLINNAKPFVRKKLLRKLLDSALDNKE